MTKTNQLRSVPDTFRSLPWSLEGQIVNKSSNIIKYSPENEDQLCGVFDKTDAQQWNESHVHNCYITMRSICCHCYKPLAPVSRSVIGDWSHITKKLLWLWYMLHVHVGNVMDHVNSQVQNLRGGGGDF